MNYNNLCPKCFCEKPSKEAACPGCGYRPPPQPEPGRLPQGTLLRKRYIAGVVLGTGGFGITYKCFDTEKGGICAIKEYFPANFAKRSTKAVTVAEQNMERYRKIMQRFVEEAVLLKSLRHRNIVKIYDNFFENNTAYYVMEYCDGIDLKKYTGNFTRKLGYEEGMNLLYQVMNGLEYIHSKGVLHRDIAPDNIYVTSNGTVKILDFGSARREMDQLNRELSAIVKVGYAPVEQYGGGSKQGPAVDIYALGATFYHLFTGKTPLESTQRVAEDKLIPFSTLRPDLPDNLKYCIEAAMAVASSKRIPDIPSMKKILGLTYQNTRIPKNDSSQQRHSNDISGAYSKENPHISAIRSNQSGPARAETGARVCACCIDLIIWGVVYLSAMWAAFGASPASMEMCVLFPAVFTIINTFFELISASTIGKMLLKLYVCGADGSNASPYQILMRNIIKLLGIFVLVFAKNGIMLQDRLTKSTVRVKK